MPLYEYRCESCSGTFERLLSFAEREIAPACPTCASSKTRVLVSSFALSPGEGSLAADFSGGGCCGGSCGCASSAN